MSFREKAILNNFFSNQPYQLTYFRQYVDNTYQPMLRILQVSDCLPIQVNNILTFRGWELSLYTVLKKTSFFFQCCKCKKKERKKKITEKEGRKKSLLK